MEDLDKQVADALGYPAIFMVNPKTGKDECYATIPPLRGFSAYRPTTNPAQWADLLEELAKNHKIFIGKVDSEIVVNIMDDDLIKEAKKPSLEAYYGSTLGVAICKAVIASKEK